MTSWSTIFGSRSSWDRVPNLSLELQNPQEKQWTPSHELIPPYALAKEVEEANVKDRYMGHFMTCHETPELGTIRFGPGQAKDQTPYFTCKVCKTRSYKMSQCSRCKKVYYCNIKCQKKHWKHHKKKCSMKL